MHWSNTGPQAVLQLVPPADWQLFMQPCLAAEHEATRYASYSCWVAKQAAPLPNGREDWHVHV